MKFQKDLTSMDGKNGTSRQMHNRKKTKVAASKLNGIPEARQEVKKHLGDGAAKNKMKRIKMAENKEEKKGKQSNDVNRKSRKRKSENNEKLVVEKEETTLETDNQLIETDNQLIPTPLAHIPLKSLMDIETELVYTDEEDIPFEFAGPVLSTSKHSALRQSKKAAALRAADGSALPWVDKELQRTLWEASTCYRQKNYEAAAEQFSAALEVGGLKKYDHRSKVNERLSSYRLGVIISK